MVDGADEEEGNVSLPPRLQSRKGGNTATIINIQTAFYDILIKDGERNIERLENRNDELPMVQENVQASIDRLDIETGDEIARLNKSILLESDRVEEIERKINNLEKLRYGERQAHLNNVESSNEKYERTRVALTLSIRALNAKINTLEDYKNTRSTLLEKLKLRDDNMERNETDAAQKRDAAERKFKIDRDKYAEFGVKVVGTRLFEPSGAYERKLAFERASIIERYKTFRLKSEMFSRLLGLAGTFQLENGKALALPVHRLMRENIFIRAELSLFVEESSRRQENSDRMRTMQAYYRRLIRSDAREIRKNLINLTIQRYLLKILKKMHYLMEERLACLPEPSSFLQDFYDRLYDSMETERARFEKRTRQLEILFYQKKVWLERVKYLKARTELRTRMYEEILYDVKYAVACALKLTDTDYNILQMSTTELISHLLYLFTRGQCQIEQCLAALSIESVPHLNEIYAKGDLGFEPEHIDLKRESPIQIVSLIVEKSNEIIPDIPAKDDDDVRLSATPIVEHKDESQTRSATSTRTSDTGTLVQATSTETKQSLDDQGDIFDPISVYENEETFSDVSEEEAETR